MDIQAVDQQMLNAERELLAENRRLRSVVESLCGFVATARRINNPEWMDALCERVNTALEAIGDDDMIQWDAKGDWIYTTKEIDQRTRRSDS
jgi:hypothetical protein